MTAPREALWRRLAELALPNVTVAPAPIRSGAPPLLVIAPGSPYRRPAPPNAACTSSWRLDVWCVTTREDVAALDTQDYLADAVKGVAEADDWAIDGLECLWLGVERANVAIEDLAGIPGLATIVQLRVDQ